MNLPDPRRYAAGNAVDPLWQLEARELIAALRDLAGHGRDAEIRAALAAAPSQQIYARLWRALCAAVEKPPADEAVAPRVFAMPWVIVCGASADAVVDCVLRDAAELARVLERQGVFGPSRNLGLSNVLCSVEAIEALPPSVVLRWSQQTGLRDVPPAPIQLARGDETVHVRFLLGAAIAPAHVPDIVETAANVGAWGTPALKAMTAQLATPNVQILPMPRPPAGVYTGAYTGRRAGLETAFNLFMSHSVRRFRMTVGDPSITVSAHEGGELRMTLWTALDDTMVEGFRWPLHPADNLEEVGRTIMALAEDARLGEPSFGPGIRADRTPSGAVLFPTQ